MLEDELEILVDLCKALVGLHAILIPLDFKLCLATWKVYGNLVKENQERLAEKLPQGEAIEVLAGALLMNLRIICDHAKRGEGVAKEMEKAVIKAGALTKNINNIVAAAASPDKVVSPACPQLLQLLLDLQQPPIAPLWLGEFHRQRLISEVTFVRSTIFSGYPSSCLLIKLQVTGLTPVHNLMSLANAKTFHEFIHSQGKKQVEKLAQEGIF